MTAARTRRVTKVPGYLLHKKSGQARVRLNGVDHYLGPHGSDESHRKYNTLIAEYLAGAVFDQDGVATVNSGLTIAEIAAAFLKHARQYYVKNGKETDEVECLKSAVRPLLALYPDLPANEFGPIALKAVRQIMIGVQTRTIRKKEVNVQWTRRYINMSVSRIRRMFKWAVENELVDERVLIRLQAVAPLMEGRTDAKEHIPRDAVSQDAIDRVRTKVPARTRDMIDIWLLTGARPGELVKLTGEMIDRTSYQKKGVWVAELADHKMVHKKKRRVLVFGPKAQLILSRYMSADPSKRLFPINRATASDAMKKACRELNIPIFTAHWLRHTAATRVREDYGLDAAQVTLGHSKADTTELYAGLNLEKAIEVARDAG